MVDQIQRTAGGRDIINRKVQTITAAHTVDVTASEVKITGPASGTYAITLAAPAAGDTGHMLLLEMISTTSTNTATLALTNVVGQSTGTSCAFNSAGDMLLLIAASAKWVVLKEVGVALT
jgi:hypothetical protein